MVSEETAERASETPRAEASSEPAPRRLRSAIALGVSLAVAGFLPKASITVAALTTLGAAVVAVALAHGDAPPLAALPGISASALAWGAGFMFAVAASARAFDRDAADGIRMLARARGVSLTTYAVGRVLALATWLTLIVLVGALITGGVCALVGRASRHDVGYATLATIPYAFAFGILVAPLAAATLGARSRGRGYFVLLSLLVVPELLQNSIDSIPERWRVLFGIPSVMHALREALTRPHVDAPLAGAAAAVIFVVALVAMIFAIEQAHRAGRAMEMR